MDKRTFEKLFTKYEDEYLKFELIENKLSKRQDLHVFMLLDALVPGDEDIISCSEHDEYYLSVDAKKLRKVVTEENIRDLVRCGVNYDSSNDWFSLFS